jgi:hypothetical protein
VSNRILASIAAKPTRITAAIANAAIRVRRRGLSVARKSGIRNRNGRSSGITDEREIVNQTIAPICQTNSTEDYNMPILWYTKVRSGRGGSRYLEYYKQPVAITTPNAELLLTPCAMEMLGNPKHVKIGQDQYGVIVLEPSDSEFDFTIQYVRGGKSGKNPEKTQMARISAAAVVKSNGMVSEDVCFVWVIEQHRNGYLGIDLKQKRGTIPFHHRLKSNGNK